MKINENTQHKKKNSAEELQRGMGRTVASAASMRHRSSDAGTSHSARFAIAISQNEMWCKFRYWFWACNALW